MESIIILAFVPWVAGFILVVLFWLVAAIMGMKE